MFSLSFSLVCCSYNGGSTACTTSMAVFATVQTCLSLLLASCMLCSSRRGTIWTPQSYERGHERLKLATDTISDMYYQCLHILHPCCPLLNRFSEPVQKPRRPSRTASVEELEENGTALAGGPLSPKSAWAVGQETAPDSLSSAVASPASQVPSSKRRNMPYTKSLLGNEAQDSHRTDGISFSRDSYSLEKPKPRKTSESVYFGTPVRSEVFTRLYLTNGMIYLSKKFLVESFQHWQRFTKCKHNAKNFPYKPVLHA